MGRIINGDNLDLSLHHSSRHDYNINEGEKDQKMTIFFNGKVFVADAIELQARAILWSATLDFETRMKMAELGSNKLFQKLQLHGLPLPGCSIKSSLKLFLQQKRKRQVHANSPCPYVLINSTP